MQSIFTQLPVCEAMARAIYALEDPHGWRVWRQLCVALPAFGRYSLYEWVQREAKMEFTRSKTKGILEAWFLPNGKVHRENDEPALICKNGGYILSRSWIQNGLFHRDNDKPAFIGTARHLQNNFRLEWYKEGLAHRDNDKPAFIDCGATKIDPDLLESKRDSISERDIDLFADVIKHWYYKGWLHRDDNKLCSTNSVTQYACCCKCTWGQKCYEKRKLSYFSQFFNWLGLSQISNEPVGAPKGITGFYFDNGLNVVTLITPPVTP